MLEIGATLEEDESRSMVYRLTTVRQQLPCWQSMPQRQLRQFPLQLHRRQLLRQLTHLPTPASVWTTRIMRPSLASALVVEHRDRLGY